MLDGRPSSLTPSEHNGKILGSRANNLSMLLYCCLLFMACIYRKRGDYRNLGILGDWE